MNDVTDNQQQISDELLSLVMQKVYTRIAPVLTEEDMTKIEQLNGEDASGNAVRYYLLSIVPNFDQIFQEEANLLKSEVSSNPQLPQSQEI